MKPLIPKTLKVIEHNPHLLQDVLMPTLMEKKNDSSMPHLMGPPKIYHALDMIEGLFKTVEGQFIGMLTQKLGQGFEEKLLPLVEEKVSEVKSFLIFNTLILSLGLCLLGTIFTFLYFTLAQYYSPQSSIALVAFVIMCTIGLLTLWHKKRTAN